MHGSSKAIAQHTTKYILRETTSKEAIKQICNVNKDLTLLPVYILAALPIGSIELLLHLTMFSFYCPSPSEAFLQLVISQHIARDS